MTADKVDFILNKNILPEKKLRLQLFPAKLFRSSRIFLLPLFLLAFSLHAFSQNGAIKKSTKTEVIEGKKYYDHKVEKGQTLYAIAKAYDLSVNDILLENPDALNGIHPGQVLKIPFEKPVVKPIAADTGYFIHKVESGQTL